MATAEEEKPFYGIFMQLRSSLARREIGMALPFLSDDPLADPTYKKQDEAFAEHKDFFTERGITYVEPVLSAYTDIGVGENRQGYPQGKRNVPTGLKITQEQDIQKFIEGGGKLMQRDMFEDITFRKSPTGDTLSADIKAGDGHWRGALTKRLPELGINFTEADGKITIEGDTNLTAIALSGARFTGSQEYLEKFGYRVGRA